MVDNFAALNANIVILIGAVTNLTVAINDRNRLCHAAPSTIPEAQVPTGVLGDLSLAASPPSTPNSGTSVSASTGDSPDAIREHLAATTSGHTQGPWYVVTVGQEPGVYQDLAEVAHLTSGISGNAYKKYTSQAGAVEAYERAWNLGAVRRVR